jgi:hypothetical protein
MSDAPRVSVLVRSMDRPALQRALDSIAAQDYAHIEVIVVAACGPGHRDLPERCGAFPLRLVRPAQRLPRADAANAALDATTGDWLNLLDDDDEFLPGHVSALRAAADADPDARFVHSMSEDCAADGRVLQLHGARFKAWRQLDTGFMRSHCALFARSLLVEGARFDPRFSILEDMDFFIQCAQKTRFRFLDRVTARYHADAGESGAGTGVNRDAAKIRPAIAVLREKWASLEATLRAMPEFRLEHALWLLRQVQVAAATELIEHVLAECPDFIDALALACVMLDQRGERAAAMRMRARLGGNLPALDEVAEIYLATCRQLDATSR